MNRTGAIGTRRTRLERAGRLAALLVALAGLFAMHGMADHGTAGHGAMLGMASGTSASIGGPDVMTHGESHADMAAPSHSQQLSPTDGDSHDQMGLLGLCLAVLATLFALVTVVLLWWRRVTLAALLPAGQLTRRLWVRARDPAPPDLFSLSIQRC